MAAAEEVERTTRALRGAPGGGTAELLCARAAALLATAKSLRARPAALSERHAMNGHDPTHLARLALRDAEKAAAAAPDDLRPLLHKANALVVLERTAEALEALLEGMSLDPTDADIRRALAELDAQAEGGEPAVAAAAGTDKRRKLDRRAALDELDCTLCSELLYEPTTLSCGHSFCRRCLAQALDHRQRCPVCRTVVFLSPSVPLPVSVTLQALICRLCPDETAARREEIQAALPSSAASSTNTLPMFVMTAMVPGQAIALNIFEPRYRLMIRRCLEGNRRLGMIGVDQSTGDMLSHGCEAEIVEADPMPDGRFSIELLGKGVFRVLSADEQDGYRVAKVERLEDGPLSGEDVERARRISAAVDDTLSDMRSRLGEGDVHRLEAFVQRLGPRPDHESETSSFVWWIARTLDEEQRAALLTAASLPERLSALESVHVIGSPGAGAAGGEEGTDPSGPARRCTVM